MTSHRIAVIGGGHLGKIHSRLLKTSTAFTLVAIAETHEQARKTLSQEFQVPAVADYRELLAQVDAVVIATPTANHLETALWCLENGIHCFVEKPLVRSSRHAELLVHIARRRNLILQVGHVERFSATWNAAIELIDQPFYIQSHRTSGFTGRSTDIGVVFDLMIHDLDLILSCIEGEVVTVEATGRSIFGAMEDVAEARLTFDSGAVASLHASRVSRVAQRRMTIECETDTFELDFGTGIIDRIATCEALCERAVSVDTMTAEQRKNIQTELFSNWLPHSSITPPATNAIVEEHNDFANAISTGVAPRVSGVDAKRAVTIAEKIVETISANAELRKRAREDNDAPAIIPAAHRFGHRRAS